MRFDRSLTSRRRTFLFEDTTVYRIRYSDGSYRDKIYRKKGHAKSARRQIESQTSEVLMIEELTGQWVYSVG